MLLRLETNAIASPYVCWNVRLHLRLRRYTNAAASGDAAAFV